MTSGRRPRDPWAIRNPSRPDAELGDVRYCPTCAEWWPDGPDFWFPKAYEAGEVSRLGNGRTYVRRTSGVTYRCLQCDPRYLTRRVRTREEAVAWARTRAEGRRDERRVPGSHQCRTPGCVVIVPPGRDDCYGCSGLPAGPLTVDWLRDLGLAPGAVS